MSTPRSFDFRQVDVFAGPEGRGNPVAVVLGAEGISEEQMKEFSVWTNLSEVAFVTAPQVAGADYSVRIYSLDEELPFAGHPTLGTARAWLDAGGVPHTPGTIIQHCPAGLIPMKEHRDRLAFAAPPMMKSGSVDDHLQGQIRDIFSIKPKHVRAMRWIDNGPGWVGVLLNDPELLDTVAPNLAGYEGAWSIGMAAVTPGQDHDLMVRAFFSDVSCTFLREDPVTGSLNASLAQWLTAEGILSAPYRARQGTGLVHVDQVGDDLWIGGQTEVLITGTVRL